MLLISLSFICLINCGNSSPAWAFPDRHGKRKKNLCLFRRSLQHKRAVDRVKVNARWQKVSFNISLLPVPIPSRETNEPASSALILYNRCVRATFAPMFSVFQQLILNSCIECITISWSFVSISPGVNFCEILSVNCQSLWYLPSGAHIKYWSHEPMLSESSCRLGYWLRLLIEDTSHVTTLVVRFSIYPYLVARK